MIRKIIQIDRERCNGCGACAQACHEGAIGMVDGKAMLLRDDYCDGLGACLPNCPVDALSVIEREAEPFDEQAVARRMAQKAGTSNEERITPAPHVCPGSMSRSLSEEAQGTAAVRFSHFSSGRGEASALAQWPVQLRLVPVKAPYFDGAKLLIAADCCAYAYAAFHRDFIAGHTTVIGCPKLDEADYKEKLTAILAQNEVKSVTVVRMEVPCCGGIERAVKEALRDCGKMIPWRSVTLSLKGKILEDC